MDREHFDQEHSLVWTALPPREVYASKSNPRDAYDAIDSLRRALTSGDLYTREHQILCI